MKLKTRLMLLLLLLSPLFAVAAEKPGEITTEVAVTERDDTAEQAAMEASLVQALETLTHNEAIGETAIAGKLKKKVDQYLLEYQYEEAGDNGWLLRSRFDGAALAAALQQGDETKSGLMHDEMLFWLVYARGDRPGKVLGRLSNEKLVGTVENAARSAGIKAVLPLYDLQDKELVTAGDIETGYVEGIERATGRYHVAQYLSGVMRRNGKIWHVQLEQYGVVAVGESTSLTRALKLALNQLRTDTADIAQQVAALPMLRITVAYVKSWADYKRLSRYLASMKGVEEVKSISNDGDLAVFDLKLKDSEDAWLKAISEDGVLARSNTEFPGNAAANYYFFMASNPVRKP